MKMKLIDGKRDERQEAEKLLKSGRLLDSWHRSSRTRTEL